MILLWGAEWILPCLIISILLLIAVAVHKMYCGVRHIVQKVMTMKLSPSDQQRLNCTNAAAALSCISQSEFVGQYSGSVACFLSYSEHAAKYFPRFQEMLQESISSGDSDFLDDMFFDFYAASPIIGPLQKHVIEQGFRNIAEIETPCSILTRINNTICRGFDRILQMDP